MQVLVTGGAGFIGSFLVDRLLASGHRVRVLDNLDAQVHPDGLSRYLAAEAELVVGDVRDRGQCRKAVEGVDVVVHAAAAVGVGQSLYRVEHYVDVNVRGTATLLDCLAERKPAVGKLVMLTSMTGYGEGLYRRPSDGALVRVGIRSADEIRGGGWEPRDAERGEVLEAVPTPEEAALLARNVYALTKRYQEELALSVGPVYGFPVVCLRLFNVYGPRQSLGNPYTGVLAIFLSRLLADAPPVVYEDGGQSRDFVSVHDVVDAVLAALASPAADGQVVNIGSGVPRRIGEIAHLMAGMAGRPDLRPRITGEFRTGDVRHCTADIGRARRLLGWAPRVEWTDGVAELLAWARTAGGVDRFPDADRELRERGLLARASDAGEGSGR
jgi:dTDP-L-rhamnose 4-epimerase